MGGLKSRDVVWERKAGMRKEKEARKKLKLGLAEMIAQEVWAEHKI